MNYLFIYLYYIVRVKIFFFFFFWFNPKNGLFRLLICTSRVACHLISCVICISRVVKGLCRIEGSQPTQGNETRRTDISDRVFLDSNWTYVLMNHAGHIGTGGRTDKQRQTVSFKIASCTWPILLIVCPFFPFLSTEKQNKILQHFIA